MDTISNFPKFIRQKCHEMPNMRACELAEEAGISEAELVAAHCGHSATRLTLNVPKMLSQVSDFGSVMCLTRNELAVHEKIGPFEKVSGGEHVGLALGKQIDLRFFPHKWAHAFAVSQETANGTRRSLQFFDAAGQAIHKIYMRAESNLQAYEDFCHHWRDENQTDSIETISEKRSVKKIDTIELNDTQISALRQRWKSMTDVHQYVGLLKEFNLNRYQAVQIAGEELAWQLESDALLTLLTDSVKQQIPIMCFVGNQGMIQIHTGQIQNVKIQGPWLNIMDDTFHLHLKKDHIHQLWAVRKANADGYVTSLEAFDQAGEMIIQFFGKRLEGTDERQDWRQLISTLAVKKYQQKAG